MPLKLYAERNAQHLPEFATKKNSDKIYIRKNSRDLERCFFSFLGKEKNTYAKANICNEIAHTYIQHTDHLLHST